MSLYVFKIYIFAKVTFTMLEQCTHQSYLVEIYTHADIILPYVVHKNGLYTQKVTLSKIGVIHNIAINEFTFFKLNKNEKFGSDMRAFPI